MIIFIKIQLFLLSHSCLLKNSKGKYVFIDCQGKVKAELTKGFQTFQLLDT